MSKVEPERRAAHDGAFFTRGELCNALRFRETTLRRWETDDGYRYAIRIAGGADLAASVARKTTVPREGAMTGCRGRGRDERST